jgi:hypothetical protein
LFLSFRFLISSLRAGVDTEHPGELLRLLHSLVILSLGYLAAVQHLLYLLPRVTLELLPELLEPLEEIVLRTDRVKQWALH